MGRRQRNDIALKIAFGRYFIRKMRAGNAEPAYEKYVLKALGMVRLTAR